MKIQGDDIIFSTGKSIYANRGIIGISPDLTISEGYDGGINEEELTQQDRNELSDYMVAQWSKWRIK